MHRDLCLTEIGRGKIEIVRSQLSRGGPRPQQGIVHPALHAAMQKIEIDAHDHAQDKDGCENAAYRKCTLFSQPILVLGWIVLPGRPVRHSGV